MAEPTALPYVPQMKTTLSYASPEGAAQIRSAVTGALTRDARTGLFCFERTVETTFVLPWDLHPQAQPLKLSAAVRDRIRTELMDAVALRNLEASSAINWAPDQVKWQSRPAGGPGGGAQQEWTAVEHVIGVQLESSYYSSTSVVVVVAGGVSLQVDHDSRQLLNPASGEVFEIRRLGLAPLMPMKTEEDAHSLFHAASMGLWGVHDRTALLLHSVRHTLDDPKAMFPIYDRWSLHIARSSTPQAGTEFPQWEAAKQDLTGRPELHIFTLSNVIQRPIIVYSSQDCQIGGVYLPLLWEGQGSKFICNEHPHLRNPLVLGYDASRRHFVPLVTFRGSKGPDPILYPLISSTGRPLPLHFLSEAQVKNDPLSVLAQLMYVDIIPTAQSSVTAPPSPLLLAAVSTAQEMPTVMDTLVRQYQSLFL